MIYNVADLKNRILVESNTLKSFILASKDGFRTPLRDDILIHDYQTANSVTLNTLLSNYIVNLNYAWDVYNGMSVGGRDTYFTVSTVPMDQASAILPKDTRLVLDVSSGDDGVFLSRKLRYSSSNVACLDGSVDFVSLDGTWYAIVRRVDNGEDSEIGGDEPIPFTYDALELMDGMNSSIELGIWGEINPFKDKALVDGRGISFNGLCRQLAQTASEEGKGVKIERIIYNRFYGNEMDDVKGSVGELIVRCRYLVCLTHSFLGLEPTYDGDGEFAGFRLIDLGMAMPNLDQASYQDGDYMFKSCGFHVVDGECTLFLVFSELEASSSEAKETYHYVYLNDATYDRTYGFTQMTRLVTDGMIVDPADVFSKVEDIKDLDTVTIAMTDYGFWDIEPNKTKDVTQSYWGRKEYSVTDLTDFNNLETKLLKPTTQGVLSTDKVVQYDKVWRLDEADGTYACHEIDSEGAVVPKVDDVPIFNGQTYLASVLEHPFVGATDEFAVYGAHGGESAFLLAGMDLDQFGELLFATPELVNKFMDWLYGTVTYAAPVDHFLEAYHSAYVDVVNEIIRQKSFTDISYRFEDGDTEFVYGKFNSIKDLATSSGDATLAGLCAELKGVVEDHKDLSWLLCERTLVSNMKAKFPSVYGSDLKDGVVDDALNGLLNHSSGTTPDPFKPLSYFKGFLKWRFGQDLVATQDNVTVERDVTGDDAVVKDVQNLIKDKIPASLALAGAAGTDITSYFHWTKLPLQKSKVEDIYSTENVKREMEVALKSTHFFGDGWTYGQAAGIVGVDWFKVTDNVEFASLSKMLDGSGTLGFDENDWNRVHDWLYPTDDGQDASHILHAFIKTQVYRPMFFSNEDHDHFTMDERRYAIDTKKSYINHDGKEQPLEFVEGTWPDNPKVDKNASGMVVFGANYSIDDPTYYKLTNVLKYTINYDPIAIKGEKFVHEDVEFYVERLVEEGGRIQAIHFNDTKEGEKALVKVQISTTGIGRYPSWGLEFKFNDGWSEVYVVRHCQTEVIDRVVREWCEFDDVDCQITQDRTFEWWLANQIAKVVSENPSNPRSQGLLDAGNGVLYDGALNDADFALQLVNEVQFGNVVTKATLNASRPGKPTTTQDIGTIIGKDGNAVPGKVLNAIEDSSSQYAHALYAVPAVGTSFVIVKKDVNGGLNNVNCVRIQNAEWERCFKRTRVGTVENDSDDGTITVNFDGDAGAHPERIVLTRSNSLEGDYDGAMYQVSIQTEGDVTYEVRQVGDEIHIVADGVRYVIENRAIPATDDGDGVQEDEDVSDEGSDSSEPVEDDGGQEDGNLAYRIDCPSSIGVSILDFSTQYGYDALLDSLLSCVRQAMYNLVLGALLNSKAETPAAIAIPWSKNDLNLYVDLLPDATSRSIFTTISGDAQSSTDALKYAQVFKGHDDGLDMDGIIEGNAWTALHDLVTSTFAGGASSILLTDEVSIDITKVLGVDAFTYQVFLNLNLNVKKELLSDVAPVEGNFYTPTHLAIKDMPCQVTFTPSLTDGGDGMEYTVKVVVPNGTYFVECDQLAYRLNGRIRVKALSPILGFNVTIDGISFENGMRKPLSAITDETITKELLEELFITPTTNNLEAILKKVGSAFGSLGEDGERVVGSISETHAWGFGEQPPDDARLSHGRTIVDGLTYGIVDEPTQDADGRMAEVQGLSEFGIRKLEVNQPDSSSEGGLHVYAALGVGEEVSFSYLDGIFECATCKEDRFLQFKGNVDRFPTVDMLNQTYTFDYHTFTDDTGNPYVMDYLDVVMMLQKDLTEEDVLETFNDGAKVRIVQEYAGPDTASIDSAGNLKPEAFAGKDAEWIEGMLSERDDVVEFGASLDDDSEFSVEVPADGSRIEFSNLQYHGYQTMLGSDDSDFLDSADSSLESTLESARFDWLGRPGTLGKLTAQLASDGKSITVTYDNGQPISIPLPAAEEEGEGGTSIYLLSPNPTFDIDTCCIQMESSIPIEKLNWRQSDLTLYIALGVCGLYATCSSDGTISLNFKVLGLTRSCFAVVVPTTFGDREPRYVLPNGYIVQGDESETTVKHIYLLDDVQGNSAGRENGSSYTYLDYGIVSCPTNADQVDTIDRLEFKRIYIDGFTEPDANGIAGFTTGGRYCPCVLNVLPPEDSPLKEGDVYGRYYGIDRQIVASPAWKEDVDVSGKISMDAPSTVNSIHANGNDSWKGLVYGGETELGYVPYDLRLKVKDAVMEALKLDAVWFDSVLGKLQGFLEAILDELNLTGLLPQVNALCSFKYKASVNFMEYGGRWDQDDEEHKGLFRHGSGDVNYREGEDVLSTHFKNEFILDYGTLTGMGDATKDYNFIIKADDCSLADIYKLKTDTLAKMYLLLDTDPSTNDRIWDVYGDGELANKVRYLNRIDTSIMGDIVGMFVVDGKCSIFSKVGSNGCTWHRFDASESYMDALLRKKLLASSRYTFEPSIRMLDFPIVDDDWLFKMANRDLSSSIEIKDAFSLHCKHTLQQTVGSSDYWWLSSIDVYLYTVQPLHIVDVAYEQNGDATYVLFHGDDHLYRYDHISRMVDSQGRVLLVKENASAKMENMHTTSITDRTMGWEFVYVDYEEPKEWDITLYGKTDATSSGKVDIERWFGSPGKSGSHFKQFNNIIFGDSLFDEWQLRFQNISKNKDMFDILDVNEIDGCYYGLFRDESTETLGRKLGYDLYTVFKTEGKGGVVHRLPYQIVKPQMYRTNDELYSLYVIEQVEDGVKEDGSPAYKVQLREISVPDSDIYAYRTIDIYGILGDATRDADGNYTIDHDLNINQLVLSEFKPGDPTTSFFALTDMKMPFWKVSYTNDFEKVSIDTLQALKNSLATTLQWTVIQKHLDEMHHGDQSSYFDTISSKVNQFDPDFSMFSLIPTEFSETQDVGVIPNGKVDDTDELTDHRVDSVQVSTDILWTDGIVAGTDTNPGIISAAVSNPATTYDDDNVFTKSQRNPSLSGTEFYDFIYDQDGNTLLDIYSVPFIYRINSNNTYDLYINVPTTRTKYLNRVAGTLKDDRTTQVLPDDQRTRVNFLDESMPNNLDESTTRLRIYIDRKFVSVGNVELVEISGNSIPTQIYRDIVNGGLYDSIALESRWDGEVVVINEPSKDINKVMLEFECYGTDSQSIHISGKTLVNHALDDGKYKFGSTYSTAEDR